MKNRSVFIIIFLFLYTRYQMKFKPGKKLFMYGYFEGK